MIVEKHSRLIHVTFEPDHSVGLIAERRSSQARVARELTQSPGKRRARFRTKTGYSDIDLSPERTVSCLGLPLLGESYVLSSKQ